MQCGFAFLECGAVRSKNATNILIKNMLDSCKLVLHKGWDIENGTRDFDIELQRNMV